MLYVSDMSDNDIWPGHPCVGSVILPMTPVQRGRLVSGIADDVTLGWSVFISG